MLWVDPYLMNNMNFGLFVAAKELSQTVLMFSKPILMNFVILEIKTYKAN